MVVDLETLIYLTTVDLPATEARAGGWSIDPYEVGKAVRTHLQLKHPVRIRYASGKYRFGTHYARSKRTPDGVRYSHLIVLNHNCNADEANETLWHELAHALQSEVFERETGMPITKSYKEAYGPLGKTGGAYLRNPFERHAYKVAAAHRHWRLIN